MFITQAQPKSRKNWREVYGQELLRHCIIRLRSWW
jgi:hypothetical protein